MKVQLPDKIKISKKQWIIYISIAIVCIISIIISFYVQFYARIDIGKLIGIKEKNELGNKTEEETQALITDFEQIFKNNIEDYELQISVKSKQEEKPIVYTNTEKKESKSNNYDIEVHIPYINIDNEIIDQYNKEISDFENKTNSILKGENQNNTIYTVEYAANIKDDILSLVIRSNLKEGSSAQRVIIQTYNYDLRNNKEISLEEMLKIKGADKNEVQNKIDTQIQKEQKKVEDLKKLGYDIYSRDTKSEEYKVENTKEFYLSNNTIYIIYAYGNETFTSETDLIVI